MMRILRRLLETRRQQPRRRRPSRVLQAGFTLLEIMIVLAIIAAIATGVGVTVFSQYKKAQVKIARERVKEIMQGVTTFMIDNNNCPRGMEDLVSQKYVPKGSTKDPWGKDFTLRCPGTQETDGADVSSTGPDKQDGTADDIKSWDM